MALMQAIVDHPVKVFVGVLLVGLFGVVALFSMPMQLTPEVQIPTITIETRWPGASPQEVEREIVQEQEEQLKSVEGVTKLSSESKDSVGEIKLEFLVGTDMNEALLKVNSRLQQVPEYPEDADEPIISTSNSSARAIAWFVLGIRPPDNEQFIAFEKKYPHLSEQVERIQRSSNPGLLMARLRIFAREHTEFLEILPKEIEIPKLRRFAEDVLEARFERVSGVANSLVFGGRDEELQVIVDPQRLAARRLTISNLRAALRGQNQDTSGGDFWEGKRRYVVRTLGQFRNPEQIKKVLLAYRDGAPVYVGDVADVVLGHKKPVGFVRRYGSDAIAVNAQRESGANVLEVMAGLKAANQELNDGILKQRGLSLVQVYDETDYIYSARGLVLQNIFIGGSLTIIILMIFLHLGFGTVFFTPFILLTAVGAAYISPWLFIITLLLILAAGTLFARSALIVSLAIPTSIIGSFLIIHLLGRSLNVVSLAGIAFAVGMLVDNAVVVLENIYRHIQMGKSSFQAAVVGAQEVWGAIVASTLTTLAVFIPVVFVQEEACQLFRDIALSISAAVGLSLIVSVTLIPTMSARVLNTVREWLGVFSEENQMYSSSSHMTSEPETYRNRPEERTEEYARDRSDHPAKPVQRSPLGAEILGINRWVQEKIGRQVAVVLFMIGGSVLATWFLIPSLEYLPTGNRNLVFGIILPPPGYNLDELKAAGQRVERDLRPLWDADPGHPDQPDVEGPLIADFFYVASGRQVFMGVRAANPLRAAELIPVIINTASKTPGAIAIAMQSSLFEQGLAAGRSIDIEVTGPELTHLIDIGRQLMGQTSVILPGSQARPIPSLDLSSPEMHVTPRWEQAADMGLTATELGYTVNALLDGAYATDYYVGGTKIDLSIIGKSDLATRTQDLESLPVATPSGDLVSVAAVANVVLASGPEQINHRERQRSITIQVSPPPGMALGDALERIRTDMVQPLLDGDQLQGGLYQINLGGTADKLRDTWRALQWNILLALLITYLLMAALFESWIYPLVVILSVPLGAVGGFTGLYLLNQFTSQPLDVLTMLGFVILIGTVVNNPILIVHQSLNHMRNDQMLPEEAILESVQTRIRPILMTTATTVCGLMPLVLFPGAGSELYRGLGSIVLGGLLVSTLFTLILVPTVFRLTLEFMNFLQKLNPASERA